MQGAAFLGAFFRTSPLLAARGTRPRTKLFDGHPRAAREEVRPSRRRASSRTTCASSGAASTRCARRSPRRGSTSATTPGTVPADSRDARRAERRSRASATRAGSGSRCARSARMGQDGIADPFAAISAIPAATGAVRDMSGVRMEVPEFIAAKCTGCGQCWTQCPDSAIPGLVNRRRGGARQRRSTPSANGTPLERLRPVVKPLGEGGAAAARRPTPFTPFADAFDAGVRDRRRQAGVGRRAARASRTRSSRRCTRALAEFPLARHGAVLRRGRKRRQKGTGGLLSITVNPGGVQGLQPLRRGLPRRRAGDGQAGRRRRSRKLRRNWAVWETLPDTADRFVNVSRHRRRHRRPVVAAAQEGRRYRSMVGGDGACMGCGEKTAVHLIVSAIHALDAAARRSGTSRTSTS